MIRKRGNFVKNRMAQQVAPQSTARKTALGIAISMVLTYPAALQALGLGELHSSSQLNQPLNAQIDLLSTNAKEASQLQVRLASPDVFSRVGIDRPAFLDNLKFTPVIQNGKPVIKVTSDVPISETFLNFLLEVSWPQGQLLKEYTVLLDPPVLMNTGSETADNAATVRAEPRSAGVIKRDREAERQLAEQQRQRQIQIQRQQAQVGQEFEQQARAVLADDTTPPARTSGSTRYRVKRGDTISRIASRLRYRGVTNSQMMVALFRANPDAFIKDNINYLKSGALLSKPARSEVSQYSSAESSRLVKQHYAQWKKYRSGLAAKTVAQTPVKQATGASATSAGQTPQSNNQANLKVAGADGSKTATSGQVSATATAALQKELTLAQEALASSKSENAELRSRVMQLEAIIRKKERLIVLKNDRLAKLEAQLAGKTAESPASVKATGTAAPQPPVNEPEDLATQVANQDQQSSNRIIRGEEGTAETQKQETVSQADVNTVLNNTADTVDDKDEKTEASPFVAEEKETKVGILELLSSPLVAAIGGGGLLALLLGWLLMRRSAKAPEDDIQDEAYADHENEDDSFDEDITSQDSESDAGFDTQAQVASGASGAFDRREEATDGGDAIDSILSGDDTIEEDEVLQEADVYIVYGLHEQAEDELKKAISKNPDKLEYRYKLIENYKAANDPESFVSTSKEFLKAAVEHKEDSVRPLWDKIVSWGKEVAPENELFAEGASLKQAMGMVGGAAAAGAAVQIAREAFADDGADDQDLDISGVDDDIDAMLGTDISADDFDLEADLGLGDDIDLGDDFGLDELASEIESSDIDLSDNVLSFGSTEKNTAPTADESVSGLDLEIDQNTGLDKILPEGNAYTPEESGSGDDSLDDALSFLDLSDDDEEMQQAHISTKLDLARAYLDMGDVEGARHTLEEVVIEGNDDQKREAEELLQQTG